MALYVGLEPAAALEKWWSIRQKPENQLTPEEKNDVLNSMEGLASQNPAAWKLIKTGANKRKDPTTGKDVIDVFNPGTGQWEQQDAKGYWSHWESWFQLAAGAAVGGMGAYAALAGPASAAGGGAGAASAVTPTTAAVVSAGGAATKPVIDAVTPDDYVSQIPSGSEIGPMDYETVAKQATNAGISPSLLQQLTKAGVPQSTISALTTLLGTHMANSAASDSAKTQADALKYSTDIQDAAAKRNEAFLRQQSQNAYLNSEATRRANYDQWRAREGRVSTLGAALGLGERNIPGYVPGVDPRFTSTDTTTVIPGRASGGPVDQGQPYVVGENGPEIMVPEQNGFIAPHQGGGIAPVVTPPGWDPGIFAAIVGRPPTQAETDYYSKRGIGWVDEVRSNTPGGGGQIPTPQPQTTGGGGSYDALMQALTSNYKSLGATPTGPGTGPTDISYFARRIQETGGMTPDNQRYWFGPKGRIAMELAGAVPPEVAAQTPANVVGGAGPQGPGSGLPPGAQTEKQNTNPPGSLGDIVRRSDYWWT